MPKTHLEFVVNKPIKKKIDPNLNELSKLAHNVGSENWNKLCARLDFLHAAEEFDIDKCRAIMLKLGIKEQ